MRGGDEAAARARTPGEGPTLIECKTYRMVGHSKSDRRAYRTREEEAEWQARDPLPRFRDALLAAGHLTPEEADRIPDEAAREIEECVEFAKRSPVLPVEAALEGVFA